MQTVVIVENRSTDCCHCGEPVMQTVVIVENRSCRLLSLCDTAHTDCCHCVTPVMQTVVFPWRLVLCLDAGIVVV